MFLLFQIRINPQAELLWFTLKAADTHTDQPDRSASRPYLLEQPEGSFETIGIAECTPNFRAAYEQEAATPRCSGRPPTANGMPRRDGSLRISMEQ